MPELRQTLERRLAQDHGRELGLLVGSGTTGLALLVQALGLAGRRVALPDSVCLQVPLAVQLGGAEPELLDNQWSDLGLDAQALARPQAGRGAVLAVHGYGQPCALQPLRDAAPGLPLIEDACLAQGADGVGREGLAAVLSFGSGKPLTLEHGGAIVCDDPVLMRELRRLEAALPEFRPVQQQRLDALGRAHTQLYNRAWPDGLAAEAPAFWAGLKAAPWLHRHDPVRLLALAAGLDELPERVAQRREAHEALARELRPLQGRGLQLIETLPGSVPWRLNLLVAERHRLMRKLHAAGLSASSWHPPARDFVPIDGAKSAHPVAQRLGREILNLWVDEACTPDYRARVRQAVELHLNGIG